MKNTLVTNDDRGTDGRFLKGCKPGPGNPHGNRMQEWRASFVGAVSAADVLKVVEKLVEEAKAGEPWAVKELLDRCLGKAHQTTEITTDQSVVMRIHLEVDPGPT